MTMPIPALRLVSHHLCPYVQRAAIALAEKGVAHERVTIDLSAKPDWFRAISPLGKVPLLLVGADPTGSGGTALFESAVICEFLEETAPGPQLHPEDPLERAQHRAWIEFASATLGTIAGLYTAPDAAGFETRRADLAAKMAWLEGVLGEGPLFAGELFSLVDAAFGPVFRYLDAFEAFTDVHVAAGLAKLGLWRAVLAARPSVAGAVAPDYADRLVAFLRGRQSYLSGLMTGRAAIIERALS